MKNISSIFILFTVISNFLFAENFKEINHEKTEVIKKVKNEKINTGQDLTKPLSRFDIRGKHQSFDGDKSNSFITFRVDKPIIFDNGWKLALRADLPVGYSNLSNQDSFGFGDLLGQVAVIAPQGTKNWTWFYGVQTVFNTASENNLGTGRNQLAPMIGMKADFKTKKIDGFTTLLIKQYYDIGGDNHRKKQKYLTLQPSINFNFPKGTFVSIAPEMEIKDGEWYIPFSILVGRMITPKTVVSLEYKTPIYDKKKKGGNEIGVRIGYFF